jgi:hypothetical protein
MRQPLLGRTTHRCRQVRAQHFDAPRGQRIADRMTAMGVERLDAVVECADAARHPQCVRRLQRELRIGDDDAWGEPRIRQGVLDACLVVGDPGNVRELSR